MARPVLVNVAKECALPERAARLARRERRRARLGDEPALLRGRGGGPEPQRLGQGAREDLPGRVVVVLSCPSEERERRRIEHRSRIQHLENGSQSGGRHLGAVRDCQNHADQTTPAERHPHARAHGGRRGAGRGWQVVEQLSEWGVERHPENLEHRSQGVS